ncbi:MAG: V-type ATP synthase subunit F [Clostridia bacterium]|nr:V-type ATP synthase subunit F [Clostridia bacterium]
MYNRVGVIGDKDAVLAFKSVGFEVFDASDAQGAAALIKKLSGEDFAVLFISEELAAQIPDVIKKAKQRIYPVITAIPTSKEGGGYGMAQIKKDVEKAIGADII